MEVFDEFNQPKLEDSWKLRVLFLPVCFLVAMLISSSGVVKWLSFGFRHWFHEFGHSFAAWLGSRASIPLLGFAPTSMEKTFSVYFCFLFLLGFVGWKSWQYRIWPLLIFVSLVFLAQTWVTLFFGPLRWEMFFVYAGIGGEFFFSALLVSAFSLNLPAQTYWPFLRFLVVPASVISFWISFRQWREIAASEAFIPWGTMWGGQGDSNGDMNRLRNDFGFSPDHLIQLYLNTAWICLGLIVVSYLFSIWNARRSKRN